ncbi:hypothetical protein WA026_018854 [Henosepilachna vigintioctopunctata]|uniref:Uncharacterized protein n=1 Tax=Henosepilachna vigintioctopunctata TaxID=420089 RepID=A0AAW1UPU7_9CUCU
MNTFFIAAGLLLLCGMCCQPIIERYLLRIADLSYHEHCVQCYACGDKLHQTCFVRDTKLFCRIDYDRLYIKKCLGCSERVAPEELVMRASENIFHLRCFVCVVCGIRLQKGDLYIIKQGQLFCRADYEKEVEMMQGFGTVDFPCDDILQLNRSQDGRRGPKRPRTILTTQQRRAFKSSFELSPKPCRKVRENLAKDTGLSVRIVQVWFQNQRAKIKKMQKKARQDNKGMEKDLENEEKKLLVKEEEQSPPSSAFFNDSCSDSETTEGEVNSIINSTKLDGKRHIKEELDNDISFFKHDMTLQDYQGITDAHRQHEFLSSHHFQASSIFLNPPVAHQNQTCGNQHINPIDRLYSMQNSYFCSKDEQMMEP